MVEPTSCELPPLLILVTSLPSTPLLTPPPPYYLHPHMRSHFPCSPQTSSALFFQYNSQLGPPYHILVDTNFINFSIQNKLDIVQGMMDCLYAKCVPCITDCVVGELEKLGSKFRVAQRYGLGWEEVSVLVQWCSWCVCVCVCVYLCTGL